MAPPVKITPAPVRRTITVNVPQARAFEVFTARFGTWWPKTHHIAKAEMANAIIEPSTGGRWYEKSVDGSECDWGKVLAWEPPSRVVLSWHLNGKFEVDETLDSEVEIRFLAQGPSETRVELEHRITAVDAEQLRSMVDAPSGWSGLLAMYAEAASHT